jgi:hypothetical protein
VAQISAIRGMNDIHGQQAIAFDFVTETWSDTSSDITTSPSSCTGINSFENGYFFAGSIGSGAAVAGFTFATETGYTAVADVSLQGSSGAQSGGIL